MPVSKILESMLKSRVAAGVEYVITAEGSCIIQLTLLKKNKNNVDVELSKTGITSIQQLSAHLPPGIPLFLTINGKGIIHKKISSGESDNDKTLLQKVLPNASLNDLYIQKTGVSEGHLYVSIARKSTIDEVLQQIQKNNITVISCSFGPFCLNAIIPLFESVPFAQESEIGQYHLTINDGRIENFQLMESPAADRSIHIGTDQLSSASAVSFAAVLPYFTKGKGEFHEAVIPVVNKQREEFKQKRIFQTAGWAVLVFFLSTLLINYFLFDYFFRKKDQLNKEDAYNKNFSELNDTLKKELQEKQQFFQHSGMMDVPKTSYYADQLALDLPAAIQLMDMNIHPLVKKTGLEETIAFMPKLIDISGTCGKSTELNEWIKVIKKKNWIQQVSILNYSQNRSQEAGIFRLSLTIK